MGSGSDWLAYAPVQIALKATLIALVTIAALILIIWTRRTYRAHYFGARDARALAISQDWARIVSLEIPPATWINRSLDREIVASMLLDRLDVAESGELQALFKCLRASGLLERYIFEARTWRGWKRQRALARLGRTRAPEAIPALSEALDSKNLAEVTAALRALGNIGIPRAAIPILDRLIEGKLAAPRVPLKHSLVSACHSEPALLIPYLNEVQGEFREILAQALGQIARADMADELAVLAGDPSPEVRASAARALARCPREIAIGLLFTLTLDEVWFVRLRAVSSLGQLHDPGTIASLVKSLCDTNRIVRQRAAMALTSFETEAAEILEAVITTGDKYALHSLVSELQRSGHYPEVLERVRESSGFTHPDVIGATEAARRELKQNVQERTT